MSRYFNSEYTDVSMMADDVVFTIMGTGQEHHGPEVVRQMLHYFYHIAFDATAERGNVIFADGHCVASILGSLSIRRTRAHAACVNLF